MLLQVVTGRGGLLAASYALRVGWTRAPKQRIQTFGCFEAALSVGRNGPAYSLLEPPGENGSLFAQQAWAGSPTDCRVAEKSLSSFDIPSCVSWM
jgi:hypothetical protein